MRSRIAQRLNVWKAKANTYPLAAAEPAERRVLARWGGWVRTTAILSILR